MTVIEKGGNEYFYKRPFQYITFSMARKLVIGKTGESSEYAGTLTATDTLSYGEYILMNDIIYRLISLGVSYAGVYRYAMQEYEIYKGLSEKINMQSQLQVKL